ncbi:hypothetical protein NPIL_378971 [Nephila pilipes]|uniref:Uncharacterized protein n=1 Tax=Nephila pilipes TaxID=299642 RepID=A0A8X6R4K0_NEPPI|nr:hypothetical protein NPIL_378971 [Nephila pilipes]
MCSRLYGISISPCPSTRCSVHAPELYLNGSMDTTDMIFLPWPSRHLFLISLSKLKRTSSKKLDFLIPLYQVFITCGRLFRGHGSIWLPNTSSILSNPYKNKSPPSYQLYEKLYIIFTL